MARLLPFGGILVDTQCTDHAVDVLSQCQGNVEQAETYIIRENFEQRIWFNPQRSDGSNTGCGCNQTVEQVGGEGVDARCHSGRGHHHGDRDEDIFQRSDSHLDNELLDLLQDENIDLEVYQRSF